MAVIFCKLWGHPLPGLTQLLTVVKTMLQLGLMQMIQGKGTLQNPTVSITIDQNITKKCILCDSPGQKGQSQPIAHSSCAILHVPSITAFPAITQGPPNVSQLTRGTAKTTG